MSIAHRIHRLGVLGAGQMGTGIALVSALRAKVPVLLHDRSSEQVTKGLSLVDKLLAKDVSKGRITSEEAKEARDRISVVGSEAGIKGLRDVDMVVEVSNLIHSKIKNIAPGTKWIGCLRVAPAQTINIRLVCS